MPPSLAHRVSVLVACAWLGSAAAVAAGADDRVARRPNVLFIAVDDLNHWVGHLGRNPQTVTPNLDRLAARGVSFANAYCVAPACNPSRVAVMSGMRPSTTGVYHNRDDPWQSVVPSQTLNAHFRAHGFYAAGAGKIYHHRGGRDEDWDDYAPRSPVDGEGAHERKAVGALKYAILKGGDDAVGDYHTVSYCIDQLRAEHDQPFFLACGIFRPHLPWNVPKKYFDLHPLDAIELPPHRTDDLDDLPPAGKKMAGALGDHKRVQDTGAWKELVRAYLASVSYADAMLGRLLDAFDGSAYSDDTIVVLWGDHGWHLGEKHHWRKFALWEEATRTPLIWVAPGVTPEGAISRRTVDLSCVFPTLCDLSGIPAPDHLDGTSILPLLRQPEAPWDRPALTTHGRGNHAVRTESWRYIRYADGSEELYNQTDDPYEWTNLAGEPSWAEVRSELAAHLPETERDQVAPRPGLERKRTRVRSRE